jgi:hypothetical protein
MRTAIVPGVGMGCDTRCDPRGACVDDVLTLHQEGVGAVDIVKRLDIGRCALERALEGARSLRLTTLWPLRMLRQQAGAACASCYGASGYADRGSRASGHVGLMWPRRNLRNREQWTYTVNVDVDCKRRRPRRRGLSSATLTVHVDAYVRGQALENIHDRRTQGGLRKKPHHDRVGGQGDPRDRSGRHARHERGAGHTHRMVDAARSAREPLPARGRWHARRADSRPAPHRLDLLLYRRAAAGAGSDRDDRASPTPW